MILTRPQRLGSKFNKHCFGSLAEVLQTEINSRPVGQDLSDLDSYRGALQLVGLDLGGGIQWRAEGDMQRKGSLARGKRAAQQRMNRITTDVITGAGHLLTHARGRILAGGGQLIGEGIR
jgi:hypothetical protein